MSFLSVRIVTRVAAMLLIGIAAMALPIRAQPPCPAGSVTKVIVKKLIYNGICCDVRIEYCYTPGSSPIQFVLREATVLDASCWGLSPGSPMPFTENYLVNILRDIVVRDGVTGNIPTCPTMMNVSIEFMTATCAELRERVVDPDGPGPSPEVLQLYLHWCSDVACVRECQVCVNPNDLDACTSEPKLYFQCSPNFNPGCPGVQPPTNCTNLCGS